jgi:AcrR family transcriptional regulator
MAKRKSRQAIEPPQERRTPRRKRRAPRRDAQERRFRLIAAATELFERHGYEVPFEQIAAHAGVGRGTLYRNFGTRLDLELAVVEHGAQQLMDEFRERQSQPDAVFWLLQQGSIFGALHAPVIDNAESDPILRRRTASLKSRAGRLIARAMIGSREAGLLRKDFGVVDFWVVQRMFRAYAMAVPVAKRAKAISRVLALMRKGIAPPE